mgnify:CR=1 FL=1
MGEVLGAGPRAIGDVEGDGAVIDEVTGGQLPHLAGPDEQRDVEAAIDAALAEGVTAPPRPRNIAVVFARSPDRESLRAAAHDVDEPWMFDAVRAIREDPVLATLPCNTSTCPAVAFAGDRVRGAPRLLVFVEASPRDVYAAALLRAAWRAAGLSTVAELEPRHLDDATLASWSRPAGEPTGPRPAADGRPLARWLWLAALVLLGVETWMRRPVKPDAIEVTHARVA